MQRSITRRQVNNQFDPKHFPNIHPVLKRVFYSRGASNADDLDYRLTRLLKPTLKGIPEAVTILVRALQNDERILIVGDYDADGATSTALSVRCLRALGAKHVEFLVPNRFEFGYGLSPEIVTVAEQYQPDVIVTVDNGIANIDGVCAARDKGIKVVVTDHHLPGDRLPDADAIVNPNQPDCDFVSKAAAGVGVVFYLMLALRAQLRELHWFDRDLAEPNLAEFLDLVALGTVADVVPLDLNNRILVAQGLRRIRAGGNCAGIQALLRVAGRDASKVVASDLGFIVGPRLNAAGRLDDMSLGIRCLITEDPAEALELAAELDQLNQERRSIETSMQVEALRDLDTVVESGEDMPLGVCLYRQDWHQGVIGILASRIKDRLHRPVIVFAQDDSGQLKGSGRSVKGIHLRDALAYIGAKHPEMLKKFGGHAMAAGLSLAKQDLPKFEQTFAEAIEWQLNGAGLLHTIESDGCLSASEIHLSLAEAIEQAGPWGQAFPEPSFDGEFSIVQQKLVGTKHLKLVLACPEQPQTLIDAIAFNVDLDVWPNNTCAKIKLVYKLAVNEYRGRRTVQMMVDYLEPVEETREHVLLTP